MNVKRFKAFCHRRDVRVVTLCGYHLAAAGSVACFAAEPSAKQTIVAELETEQTDKRNTAVFCLNGSYDLGTPFHSTQYNVKFFGSALINGTYEVN
jgi:hypothetical protein